MADIVYNTDGEYGKYIMQELKTPAFPRSLLNFTRPTQTAFFMWTVIIFPEPSK